MLWIKKDFPWGSTKNFNDRESLSVLSFHSSSKCQIAVNSYGIEMFSLTWLSDYNHRCPIAENILKVSTEMTEHNCYWCLWFQNQQCNRVANQQAINSCFLKGEKVLEERDMRSLPWSILSQQVRWESFLWSQDHLLPEMLLRLVHWPNTHWGRDRGGLQHPGSIWALQSQLNLD